MKQENEHKQEELRKVEKDLASLKEIKLVVTAIIKDIEKKDEKILNLERDTSILKTEIKALKEERKAGLGDLNEQMVKDLKEMKLVVTALIKDVDEKDKYLLKLEKETSHLNQEIKLLKEENTNKNLIVKT